MAEIYNHKVVEPKWQKYWEEHETFKTDVWDFSKPKYYVLDMFPYPSGVGLHAGHPEGYTATDIVSRMKRKRIPVYVWTVNDERIMKKLLRLHVDGIITDRPDILLKRNRVNMHVGSTSH